MEALGSVLLVGGLQDIDGHNIGFHEGGLTVWNDTIIFMVFHNILIGFINILGDDVAYDVVILTVQATCLGRIGGTVLIIGLYDRRFAVAVSVNLTFQRRAGLRRVPGVPLTGVVDGVGQHVACVVADIVGRTEHFFERNILSLSNVID